jgi:hypothetical protein
MKRIITLFSIIGLLAFSGCEGPEGIPGQDGLTADAFEIKNVNLGRVTDNQYSISSTFLYEIGGDLFNDETILVYRLTGTINSTTPIWQLIPRTIYHDDGNELDYDYDFSKVDFVISARGTYNLVNKPSFINNQTFRIVIIPSNLLSKVNKEDYFSVMKSLNLNENEVQQVRL